MTNYELDQAFFETNDLQDFADFLDDRKIHSRWEEVSVKNLSVNEKAAFMPNMGVSEPAAGEAAYYLKSPELSDTYLRSIAVSSLLERARIGGSALGNLTRTDFSMFVTACLATAKEDDTTKIRIQDGKISAFMAGTYRIIDQTSIFDETVQKISSEFSGEFIKGAWNHCVTLADYTVTMPTSDYADIFRSKGLTFSDIVMTITVMTSESGYSGANIYPSVVGVMPDGRRFKVPILGEIAMPHKGKASISEFCSNLSLAFSQTEKSKDRLKELDKIELNYPFNAFCNLLKKVTVRKKDAANVLDQFAVLYGNDKPATAADIYFKACEIAFDVKASDSIALMTLQENIAKILKLSEKAWSDFDRPINCWNYNI